jgi:hypothetical protein
VETLNENISKTAFKDLEASDAMSLMLQTAREKFAQLKGETELE